MTSEPEKWSSLEEIAEHLGVSKDTIRNWIKKGVIPYRRIGKQYKFRVSEVDAWVDSGKSARIEQIIGHYMQFTNKIDDKKPTY